MNGVAAAVAATFSLTFLATVDGSVAAANEATTTFAFRGLTFTSPARAGWSVAERDLLQSTLARLPDAITDRPLTIERDDSPCPPDGLPAERLLTETNGRIHLCRTDPSLLAQQVTQAVLYAVDAALGWSERADWRRLNGWRVSPTNLWRPSPDNIAPEAFVDARGAARSPRWDLVTFAAAALLDQNSGDERIVCRLISQAEFLRARLDELTPGQTSPPPPPPPACQAFDQWADLDNLEDVELILAAPSSAMVGSLFGHLLLRLRYRDDRGDAPTDLGRAVGFLADNDVPFQDDPAYAFKGIFGVYSATLLERPFLVSYRDYVVLEGRDLRRWRLNLSTVERQRLLQRIWTVRQAGRYRYFFFARNCATLLVDLINSALPPEEATTMPGVLAAPPSSILERFESARTADGRPRATYVPEPILAFEHRARLASRRRRDVEERLIERSPPHLTRALTTAFSQVGLPDASARATGYAALAPLLARADAGAASDVYQFLHDSAELESHLSTVANLEAEERAGTIRRQRLKATVSRLLATLRADSQALAALPDGASRECGRALNHALAAIADGKPALRLTGYQDLRDELPRLARLAPESAARARLLALLQSEVRYDVARMKAVPGLRDAVLFVDDDKRIDEQPYLTAGDEDAGPLLALPTETRVSAPLLALQRTKQVAFAARPLQTAPATVASGGDDAAAEPAEVARVARAYAGALPRSGIDQLAVLAAVNGRLSTAAMTGQPQVGLIMVGALYDERLGDHRRFGFPSHTAMVVARSAALLAWGAGRPTIAAYDTRLIGYRSLPPSLPESDGHRFPFGWDLALDARGSDAQALNAGLSAGYGFILRLWDRNDLADHLLATGGLAYEADFPSAAAPRRDRPQQLGVPLGLEFRRRLGPADSHRSYLSTRLHARPTWLPAGAPVRTALQAGAAFESHLALRATPVGGSHDPALLVALGVFYSSFTLAGPAASTTVSLNVGVELR
ncbi:MAG: hypothetical protein QOI66_2332 [Myxococcales bacterium]|nr:hypothetical protein [Myxococcales bacterium]